MKAILVIDVPYITEPCEIDELGLVADMHIRPTTLSLYKSFDLKDVDVRPVPSEYCTSGHNPDEMWFHGYNRAIRDIVGEDNVSY